MRHYFFLLITSFVFSQNYKSIQVNYSALLEPVLTKKTDNEKHNSLFDEINGALNNKIYLLKANSNGFIFEELVDLKGDERQKKVSKFANTIFLIFPYTFNKQTNKLYRILNDVNIESENNYQWELTNESKKIDNYTCYKATCTVEFNTRHGNSGSRIVSAWYTPEINFNYGPNGYMGLPGLILELEYNKTKIVAKEIHFFKDEIKIETPKNKEVTEEEFLNKIKEK